MTDVTLNGFLTTLKTAMPEAGVIFATEDGPVGAGYHITELKHARVSSIDCGARQSSWEEVAVQVLDVFGDAPMPVDRLRGILSRSLAALPALADAPVHVEFGHRNESLSRYEIAGLTLDDDLVKISIVRAHATCKPATTAALPGRVTQCCT
ncbi:MAG: DUF6428 family protein [Pseudomonadota bacterium]